MVTMNLNHRRRAIHDNVQEKEGATQPSVNKKCFKVHTTRRDDDDDQL